jgi:predicted enzyme related to lactoylglutathione lyase
MFMKKLISWVEIPATDFDRAVDFYRDIFNLDLQIVEGGGEKMACFPSGEGAISFSPDFRPSADGTLVSLNVDGDMDDALLKIKMEGGEIIQQKTKIEVENRGFFALFLDCEGNKIGLYAEN